MAQKIIPKSFRLNYFKNWESSSIVIKENYSKNFFFEYNVYLYLKKLCIKDKIILNKIKIKKKNNLFNIYISLFQKKVTNIRYKIYKKNFTVDLTLLDKKKDKIIKNLQNYSNIFFFNYEIKVFFFVPKIKRKYLKNKFFTIKKKLRKRRFRMFWPPLYKLMFIVILTKSVTLLNNFIIKNLQRNKNQLFYIKNFAKLFNSVFNKFPHFVGYKIQWKGRLNKKPRARKAVFKAGKVPLNTIKYNIQYDFQEIVTSSGVCSLKSWLLFNRSQKIIDK